MSDNLMSRRKFLVSAGTVAAAAGLAGVGLAKVAPDLPSGRRPYRLRGRIRRIRRKQPDPETLARRAYEVYYLRAGCAEATWWPIVEVLSGRR